MAPVWSRPCTPSSPTMGADTDCPKCSADRARVGSGNMTRCRCKKSPEHGMHRSSGVTYSILNARVKFIPAEDTITNARVTKPFGRNVGSAGLQKSKCRRSVTPPPSSLKVSVVRSPPLTQEPTEPSQATALTSTLALVPTLTWFETAENRQIASLNRPSPIFRKVVRSHLSRTSHITDASAPKNMRNAGPRATFARSCISGVLHSQVQSSAIPPAGLPKEKLMATNSSLSNGNSHDKSEDAGMNLDLTEGKETIGEKCGIGVKVEATRGKKVKTVESNINSSASLVLDLPDVPPGFTKAHSMIRRGEIAESCAGSSPRPPKETICDKCEIGVKLKAPRGKDIKTAESNVDSSASLVLDIPEVPAGFTEAQSMLRRGEIAESCADSSPRLPLDTHSGFAPNVPPGSTEAGRGLHAITSAGSKTAVTTPRSQKKTLIKFSSNVTRLSQTDISLGPSKLREVKKEPGMPAVCNSAEKTTPTGKIDELRIKNDEVKVEPEVISEREFRGKCPIIDTPGTSSCCHCIKGSHS